MSLFDALLSAAEAAGNVVDTPGAAIRSALVGENPIEAIFNTKKRKSGRELLEHYGLVRPNDEGLDAGDIAGFLAESLLDPLNLIGGGVTAKLAKGLSRAKKTNKAIKASNEVAQEANLFKDAARAKLKEALAVKAEHAASQQKMAENLIDKAMGKVIDVGKPAKWTEEIRHATPEQKMVLSYAPAHEVAKMHGFDDPLGEFIPPAAHNLAESAGARIVPTLSDDAKGYIMPHRPDLIFIHDPVHANEAIATTAHELIHSARRRFPNAYSKLESAIGESGLSTGQKRYSNSLKLLNAIKKKNIPIPADDIAREEGIAHLVSNEATKALDAGEEIGDAIVSAHSRAANPPLAEEALRDIMEGRAWRNHSLVPTGHPTTVYEHVKSFAMPNSHGPYAPLNPGQWGLTPDEAFNGLKHYQPVEALVPEHRRRLAAALAALVAHNAGRTAHSPYGED